MPFPIMTYIILTSEQNDGQSPWLKFAKGVVNSTYKSDILRGMIEALVAKQDCLDHGKS